MALSMAFHYEFTSFFFFFFGLYFFIGKQSLHVANLKFAKSNTYWNASMLKEVGAYTSVHAVTTHSGNHYLIYKSSPQWGGKQPEGRQNSPKKCSNLFLSCVVVQFGKTWFAYRKREYKLIQQHASFRLLMHRTCSWQKDTAEDSVAVSVDSARAKLIRL